MTADVASLSLKSGNCSILRGGSEALNSNKLLANLFRDVLQKNAEKGRPYSQKMQNIILNLTKSINDPENAPKLLVGNGNDKTYLCVLLTADRGLCGGFNYR